MRKAEGTIGQSLSHISDPSISQVPEGPAELSAEMQITGLSNRAFNKFWDLYLSRSNIHHTQGPQNFFTFVQSVSLNNR